MCGSGIVAWFPDILIEYRGMSIVTAMAFCLVSILYYLGWSYLQEKFKMIDCKLTKFDDTLSFTQTHINDMKVEMGIIRTTIDNVNKTLDHIMDYYEVRPK
jgi:hypothetical protein